jgi:ethanolamine utilization protein EutN
VILGRVLGTVVSTVQHPYYSGRKQLLVGAVLPDGTLDGTRYILALDMVGAGVGETVLVRTRKTPRARSSETRRRREIAHRRDRG